MWCVARKHGEKVSISNLSDRFVELNARETARPQRNNAEVYREIQAIQDQMSAKLRDVFATHRKFLDCE
jgi:hypothetical protein